MIILFVFLLSILIFAIAVHFYQDEKRKLLGVVVGAIACIIEIIAVSCAFLYMFGITRRLKSITLYIFL